MILTQHDISLTAVTTGTQEPYEPRTATHGTDPKCNQTATA